MLWKGRVRQSKRMETDKDRASREDLSEETALEQRPESTGGMSDVDI